MFAPLSAAHEPKEPAEEFDVLQFPALGLGELQVELEITASWLKTPVFMIAAYQKSAKIDVSFCKQGWHGFGL